MILRLLVLCVTGAGSYFLLKGWPAGLPVMLRACLAVLLLVGGLGLWAARKQPDDLAVIRGKRKPGWADFLAAGMGVLALECGFLWLLSVAPGPLEEAAIAIEARFSPEAAAARVESKGTAQISGNWLWDDQRERALPRRTNLKPGVKPEVFVRLPRRGDAEKLLERQVYVRAFVLDDFHDGVWSMKKSVGKELTAGEDGWIRFYDEVEEGILHEVFHGKDNGGRNVVTALQGVGSVRLPGLREASDGVWLLPDGAASGSGFEYLASARPMVLEDLKGQVVRNQVETVRTIGRFSTLASQAAGEGDLLEKLLNVQKFLRENYGYSLVTENPKNLSPMENFLFGEKRGHCEFFATAAALMVRELGVESRVAYGWAGGQYFKDTQMFVFRAREAHSWVEVKLDGYGWVAMEPTPPMVLSGGGSARVADAGETMPNPEDTITDEEFSEKYLTDAHVGRVALMLAGGFGVFAMVLFLLRKKPQTGDTYGGKSLPNSKNDYHSAWLRAVGKKLGNRTNSMTLGQQLKAFTEAPEFDKDLREYHYGVRYEEKPPDAEREGRLLKRILKWGREEDVS